eukprot:58409_1
MPFIDKAYRLGLGLKSLAGCVLRGGEKTNAALSVGRVTQNRGFASKRHKEVLSMAKGYRGRAKNCFKIAVQRVEKALQYAYRDRKTRRREFRREWITTLNAASRQHGITYGRIVPAFKQANIVLNRKLLAEIAQTEPYSFRALVDTTRGNQPSSNSQRQQ